jgi:hypothetical protein
METRRNRFSKGACITTQIGNSGRLMEALIALVDLNGGGKELLKSLRTFQGKVATHQRTPNRLVHDAWVFRVPDGDAFRYELSAQGKLVNEFIPKPTIEVTQFIKAIAATIERLNEILTQQFSWPYTHL